MNRTGIFSLLCAVGILFLTLFASCSNIEKVSYSQFMTIDSEGWEEGHPLIFEPWPNDSTEAAINRYDLKMVVRNSMRNENISLPVAVIIEDDIGTLKEDTIRIGDLKTKNFEISKQYGVQKISLTVLENLKLSEGFSVTLVPLAPKEASAGMIDIGLILEKKP